MSLSVFKMPNPVNIAGRSSTITNAFVNSIIPLVMPTSQDVSESLGVLKMDTTSICCSYCDDRYTEWDHFRAIVRNKKPTGYISEIQNLVPACGKCNQSKGNKMWDVWIVSDVRLSPKTRRIPDIDIKIQNLKAFETWKAPTKLDFATIVGTELWSQHWRNWENVQQTMKDAQIAAVEIRGVIETHLKSDTI